MRKWKDGGRWHPARPARAMGIKRMTTLHVNETPSSIDNVSPQLPHCDVRNQIFKFFTGYESAASASTPVVGVAGVIQPDIRIAKILVKPFPESVVKFECTFNSERSFLSRELLFLPRERGYWVRLGPITGGQKLRYNNREFLGLRKLGHPGERHLVYFKIHVSIGRYYMTLVQQPHENGIPVRNRVATDVGSGVQRRHFEYRPPAVSSGSFASEFLQGFCPWNTTIGYLRRVGQEYQQWRQLEKTI